MPPASGSIFLAFRTQFGRVGLRKCSSSSSRSNHHHHHMTTVFQNFQRAEGTSVASCGGGDSKNAFRVSIFGVPYSAKGFDRKLAVVQGPLWFNRRSYCSGRERNSADSKNMSGGKGPGLIVFDLDCTLWPYHVDSTVNPPFAVKESNIVDQDGLHIRPYPEVPKVLEYLQNEGYPIAAASRTTKPPAAFQLLELLDWNKFLSYKEIYPGSKITHFAKFAEQTKIPHSEMLFFDDEQRNIIDMQEQGVKCVLVTNGVDLKLVKDSIDLFKQGKL